MQAPESTLLKIILKNKFKRISLNFLNEVSFEPKIIHPG